jgi:hypothetical protein
MTGQALDPCVRRRLMADASRQLSVDQSSNVYTDSIRTSIALSSNLRLHRHATRLVDRIADPVSDQLKRLR